MTNGRWHLKKSAEIEQAMDSLACYQAQVLACRHRQVCHTILACRDGGKEAFSQLLTLEPSSRPLAPSRGTSASSPFAIII